MLTTLYFVALTAGMPQGLAAPIAEDAKSRVLVLATPHLSQYAEDFRPEALEGLFVVLERYAPDVITVEALPASVIQAMEAREDVYRPVLDTFAGERRAHAAAALEALDGAEVKACAGRGLELVLDLVAGLEWESAVLQWSLLDPADRAVQTLVPVALAKALEADEKSANERFSIGVALARRLKHERVFGIDDHMDKDLYLSIADGLAQELAQNPVIEAVQNSTLYSELAERLHAAFEGGDLLPFYRYLNSAAYVDRDVDTQWNVFFRTELPSGLDRTRIALWEVRNLNMASHIRRRLALHPGGRLLVIVGAAHKPFLEAYLRQSMDVVVEDFERLVVEGEEGADER